MDAPVHYQSKSIDGKRMMSYRRGAARLVFSSRRQTRLPPSCPTATSSPRPRSRRSFKRIGHELKPFDIVLINTRAGELHRHRRISDRRLRHGPRGDALSDLDAASASPASTPGAGTRRSFTRANVGWRRAIRRSSGRATRQAARFRYCHMEKLCNLDQLPPDGFIVACFPHKIKGAIGGLDPRGGAV